MGENSGIEWTDHTFNPWMGCTRVSEGCRNCYAETMMDRRWGKVKWGPQGARVKTSAANWRQPLKWNREAEAAGVRRRVFCASLADVFEHKGDQRPDLHEWRSELWDLIIATPHLDWLLLTKRPENVVDMVPEGWLDGFPSNVWIGTSVEDQKTADERIPELLKVPAAVLFLSVEPLLGPVDLWGAQYALPDGGRGSAFAWGRGVNWVICGGESGPGARPMHPEWVRAIRDECEGAGVPLFFKQWGEWVAYHDNDMGIPVVDETGAMINIGTKYHHAPDGTRMVRVGKKKAGRLLDGCEWNEYPTVKAA